MILTLVLLFPALGLAGGAFLARQLMQIEKQAASSLALA